MSIQLLLKPCCITWFVISLEEGVPNEVKSAIVRNLADHFNFGKKGDVTATDIQQFLDQVIKLAKAYVETWKKEFDGWQGIPWALTGGKSQWTWKAF